MFEFNNTIINNKDYLIPNNKDYIKNIFDVNGLELSDNDRLSNPIFKSIGYPSKIYYKNIQKFLELYTEKGATVLDSCCGSGSTGIAAILEGRKAILVDSSPEAINLTFNMLNYLNLHQIEDTYKILMNDLQDEINSIYSMTTSNGIKGYAESIIESHIFRCPHCDDDIVLYGSETGKRSEYKCKCGYILNISRQEDKKYVKEKRKPVEATIIYKDNDNRKKKEKKLLTQSDIEEFNINMEVLTQRYAHLWKPDVRIVYNRCYRRPGGWPGFDINASVSELYATCNIIALQILNNYIESNIMDAGVRTFFKFIFTECLFRTSNRLFTTSGLKNVYQVPSVGKVQNVLNVFERKYNSILKAKKYLQDQTSKEAIDSSIRIIKSDAKKLDILNNSVDYAFIDPPYGGVVPYAELNLFYSAWLHENENLEDEIIIPMDYDKKEEYVEIWGRQLEEAFREVYRVLKPGAYFTIVFQSRFNNIWNKLRDIMNIKLGFEFVNIVKNERGTTFHINQANDTNPQSAFITYRKPILKKTLINEKNRTQSVFDIFPKSVLKKEITLREIQTKMIYLAHEREIDYIPSDKEIKQWLDKMCNEVEGKYILK